MNRKELGIPKHLPDRLAIAMWLWNWATDIQKGEEFYDLEKAFKDLKERGFNAVRIDALWSWAYNIQGKPRGPVEIASPVEPGYTHYAAVLNTLGGIHIDSLKSILHFFELAQKYDVYVALSSWEYQEGHSLGLLADDNIRKEILGIPAREKPAYLAGQCDRLITEIKRNGFEKCIAYVELHNEISYDYFGMVEPSDNNDYCKEQLENIEKALSYLQQKHPGILFTDDHQVNMTEDRFFDLKTADITIKHFVKNAQALDHHLYVVGVQGRVYKELGFKGYISLGNEIAFMEENLKNNEALSTLLRPDAPTWEQFKKHFRNEWFLSWWPIIYLYENMDVNAWDYLMFKYYPEYEKPMQNFWKNYIYYFYKEAQIRKVPLICDEGYIFYPPNNSNFETSAVGKKNFEFIIDHMLEADYWGIMVSTYTQPECGLWKREPAWLKYINSKIIGKV